MRACPSRHPAHLVQHLCCAWAGPSPIAWMKHVNLYCAGHSSVGLLCRARNPSMEGRQPCVHRSACRRRTGCWGAVAPPPGTADMVVGTVLKVDLRLPGRKPGRGDGRRAAGGRGESEGATGEGEVGLRARPPVCPRHSPPPRRTNPSLHARFGSFHCVLSLFVPPDARPLFESGSFPGRPAARDQQGYPWRLF